MATFPLSGPLTATYSALFWVDRFPQYEAWAKEMWEHVRGAADVMLVVTDGTPKDLPDYVTEVKLPEGVPVSLRACFVRAVEEFERLGVGVFYYMGADNLYHKQEVARVLGACLGGADVVFSAFDITDLRYDGVTFPPKPLYNQSFNVHRHTWTDASCFRTACFLGCEIDDDPREFARKTLEKRDAEGLTPTATYIDDDGWWYFQHGQSALDRSFIGR